MASRKQHKKETALLKTASLKLINYESRIRSTIAVLQIAAFLCQNLLDRYQNQKHRYR